MTDSVGSEVPLAERVRQAFEDHDLEAFGELLADDVTWGDINTERGCRNSTEVLATFERILDKGIDGFVTEVKTGRKGILCGLSVTWPSGTPDEGNTGLFHVYMVKDNRIFQIRRFDDRISAAKAAGLV